MGKRFAAKATELFVLFIIINLMFSPIMISFEEANVQQIISKEIIFNGEFSKISLINNDIVYNKEASTALYSAWQSVVDPNNNNANIEICSGQSSNLDCSKTIYFPENVINVNLTKVWCNKTGTLYANSGQIYTCDTIGDNYPNGGETTSIQISNNVPGYVKFSGSMSNPDGNPGMWINLQQQVCTESCDNTCTTETSCQRMDPDCAGYIGHEICDFSFMWNVSSSSQQVISQTLPDITNASSTVPLGFVDPVAYNYGNIDNTARLLINVDQSQAQFMVRNLSFNYSLSEGIVNSWLQVNFFRWTEAWLHYDVYAKYTNNWVLIKSNSSQLIRNNDLNSSVYISGSELNAPASQFLIRYYMRYKEPNTNTLQILPIFNNTRSSDLKLSNISWYYETGNLDATSGTSHLNNLSTITVGHFGPILSFIAPPPFMVSTNRTGLITSFFNNGLKSITSGESDIFVCINRTNINNKKCDSEKLAWYNKSVCTTQNYDWFDAGTTLETDGINGNFQNYCCGDQVSDCGVIKENSGSKYLCRGTTTKQWDTISNEDHGIIQTLGCGIDISYVYDNTGQKKIYGCSDSKAGNFYSDASKSSYLGISSINITKDSVKREYVCYRNEQGEINLVACDADGDLLTGGMITAGNTIIVNGTTKICTATTPNINQFLELDNSINEATCTINGNFWTGTLCCIHSLSDSYNDNSTGCWEGTQKTATQLLGGNLNGIKENVISHNGSFYGCGFPYLRFNQYAYQNNFNQIDLGFDTLNRITQYSLSYRADSNNHNIKLTRFASSDNANSYNSGLAGIDIPIPGARYGSADSSVKQSGTSNKNWHWQYQSYVFEITSDGAMEEALIAYYLFNTPNITASPSINNLRLPKVENGNPNTLISNAGSGTVKRISENYNVSYCENIGNYYCSTNDIWVQRPQGSTSLFNHSSTAAWTVTNGRQTECCNQNQCWDGTNCVDNQATGSLNEGYGTNGSYACINGAWTQSVEKTSWDGAPGNCAQESDCFVQSSTGQNTDDFCVANMSWSGDHLCLNGDWVSRTKTVAETLTKFIMSDDDYTLFCDNYNNTLNYIDYAFSDQINARSLLENRASCRPDNWVFTSWYRPQSNCVNNICVLRKNPGQSNEEIYFGTSQNFVDTLLPVPTLRNTFLGDEIYTDQFLTNANLFIFRYDSTATPTETQVDLLDIFRNIINFIYHALVPNNQAQITINNNFDRLYLAKEGAKDVKVVSFVDTSNIPAQKTLTGSYNCFEKDICASLNITDPLVKCNYSNYRINVLKNKSASTSITSPLINNELWLGLTAKLRLDDTGNTIDDRPEGTLKSNATQGIIPFSARIELETSSCNGINGDPTIRITDASGTHSQSGPMDGNSFTALFENAGVYNVNVTMTDGQDINYATIQIIAYSMPNATLNIINQKSVYNIGENISFEAFCSPGQPSGLSYIINCTLDLDNGTTIELGQNHKAQLPPANLPRMNISYQTGGSYNLRLTTVDNNTNIGTSQTRNVIVNTPPTANAGADQEVSIMQTVTLNGGASYDADLDSLTHQWQIANKPTSSTAVLSNPNTQTPSFAPDVTGTYNINLVVNDGFVTSQPDHVIITATDSAPILVCGTNVQGVPVIRLSNETNAHVGLPSSSYQTLISCNVSRGTLDTNAGASEIFSITDTNNAHVSSLESTYTNKIRLNFIDTFNAGYSLVEYQSNNGQCDQGGICLIKITDTTNAHAATCDSNANYDYAICLKIEKSP